VSDACDVLVIGGGPAGATAAMESARRGLRTILLDEGAEAGGQVYRPALDGLRAAASSDAGPEHDAGALLRTRLAGSGVDARFGHAVW
jgi:flavin-dependent dehydrogenase